MIYGSLPDRAKVDMLPQKCGIEFDIVYRGNNSDSNELGHVNYRILASGGANITVNKASPMWRSSGTDNDLRAEWDQFGAPCALVSVPLDVTICGLCDHLDRDGDGIPLIVEQALALRPSAPDQLPATTQIGAEGGSIAFVSTVPTPTIGTVRQDSELADTSDLGEFRYVPEFSFDLQCWLPKSEWRYYDPGFNSLGTQLLTSEGAGEREVIVATEVPASFSATHPEFFQRIRIERSTP